MITVYLRFGDLASWLMLAPLKALVEDTGVSVSWRAMLDTMGDISASNIKPGEDDPLAEYRARRKEARRKAAVREHERLCEILGISTEAGSRKINPLALSLGLVWANDRGEPDCVWRYVETAFDATFHGDSGVESMGVVETLLENAGVPVERFAEAFMAKAGNLRDDQDTWIERGILSSPAFEIDGELFLGREHLPLIRWRLEGGKGPPPV